MWRHNSLWLFNIVPAETRAQFDLYAYTVYPVRYNEGHQSALPLPSVAVDPLPSSFRLLGYDAVNLEDCDHGTMMLCHAPLSCNQMAAEIAVNRYCLLDDREEAFRVAQRFSVEASGVESGRYAVVEVYRGPPS